MRILFEGEEHQVQIESEGNTIVAGWAISWNGNLLEGVEDITQYKTVLVDGVETQVEVVPEEVPEEVKVK